MWYSNEAKFLKPLNFLVSTAWCNTCYNEESSLSLGYYSVQNPFWSMFNLSQLELRPESCVRLMSRNDQGINAIVCRGSHRDNLGYSSHAHLPSSNLEGCMEMTGARRKRDLLLVKEQRSPNWKVKCNNPPFTTLVIHAQMHLDLINITDDYSLDRI